MEHPTPKNLVIEYQTLREEIGRYQGQVSSILEMSILITTGLLAVSFSAFIDPQYQWIALFSPSFLLAPFVLLMIDRVRTTWIIGRYIDLYLEPLLELKWECFNRNLRATPNKAFRSKFTQSSVMPVMVIQALFPILSYFTRPERMDYWIGISLLVFIVLLIESLALRRFTLNVGEIEQIKEAIQQYCYPVLDH
jgi:hypothetical protein